MVQTVFTVAGVGILLAALWAAREALLLIYVSALIAMGFAPLVTFIERGRRNGTRRPRWFAILLIYIVGISAIVFIALLVVPPLVAQATALWARVPNEFDRLQAVLIRYKLMRRPITLA